MPISLGHIGSTQEWQGRAGEKTGGGAPL